MTPIGELFQYVIARAERMMEFQEYLATFATAAERKATIMEANYAGWLSDEDAMLLIQSMMLETA
ncbi:hypothetical protein BSL82_09620 [Tardibacter chloracetimidivorans]|uniref:Uncharacterized protein n=1 Tax=Tardibacter chloracetimidivorans TaxID=1921510 RepID=A0A1L3ZVD4_9SPHN|nr:hypothetical protein [Tardibacter chloracetimidivorans]API59539.1 hypothetical protein BSL82_09620 [Tardibacter chloracetimidivorans]